MSFAHAGSNLLACVDQGGNLQIWDLDRAKDVAEIPTYPHRQLIKKLLNENDDCRLGFDCEILIIANFSRAHNQKNRKVTLSIYYYMV